MSSKPGLRALGLALAALLAPACAEVADGDVVSQVTVRVSTAFQDAQAFGASSQLSFSADGRYVAFASSASNLTPDDSNGFIDIFVKDRLTGEVQNLTNVNIIGVSMADCALPCISGNGRFIAFLSEGQYVNDPGFSGSVGEAWTWVYDREDQVFRTLTEWPTPWPDDPTLAPTLSHDGRYLAFQSSSPNLGFATAGLIQVFRCDFGTNYDQKVITLISADQGNAASGSNGSNIFPKISADGTRIAWTSTATNLVNADDFHAGFDVYLWVQGATPPVRLASNFSPSGPSGFNNSHGISADGNFVAYVNRDTAALIPLSVQRYNVAGDSTTMASDPIHVIAGGFDFAALSADGRYVGYVGNLSGATTAQVWRFDMTTGLAEQASVSSFGDVGNQTSAGVAISANGLWIGWTSTASNLVRTDTNGFQDVFVRGPSSPP